MNLRVSPSSSLHNWSRYPSLIQCFPLFVVVVCCCCAPYFDLQAAPSSPRDPAFAWRITPALPSQLVPSPQVGRGPKCAGTWNRERRCTCRWISHMHYNWLSKYRTTRTKPIGPKLLRGTMTKDQARELVAWVRVPLQSLISRQHPERMYTRSAKDG